MKILVLGAGVIGVTTAYQLLKDGHEVAVVESHESAGEETSAGNAGLIAGRKPAIGLTGMTLR